MKAEKRLTSIWLFQGCWTETKRVPAFRAGKDRVGYVEGCCRTLAGHEKLHSNARNHSMTKFHIMTAISQSALDPKSGAVTYKTPQAARTGVTCNGQIRYTIALTTQSTLSLPWQTMPCNHKLLEAIFRAILNTAYLLKETFRRRSSAGMLPFASDTCPRLLCKRCFKLQPEMAAIAAVSKVCIELIESQSGMAIASKLPVMPRLHKVSPWIESKESGQTRIRVLQRRAYG